MALGNELLRKALINLAAVALRVVAVVADVAFHRRALIKIDAKESEGVDNHFNCAFYITLVIGILDSEEKSAAGLVSQSFVNKSTVKVSEMNEACRAWSESGYFRALRQLTLRIELFVIVRGFGDMRKQKLRKFFIIHIYPPYYGGAGGTPPAPRALRPHSRCSCLHSAHLRPRRLLIQYSNTLLYM